MADEAENLVEQLLETKYEEWIGVDLDGTLAQSHHPRGRKNSSWEGERNIGAPVPAMLKRVKQWVKSGKKVKIFTARAVRKTAIPHVQKWLKKHGLEGLEITNQKDPGLNKFYDDRARQVVRNTGELVRP